MRRAEITRQTNETQIHVALTVDGAGQADVDTGVGFLDHMLTQLARHGLFDISVKASGDLHVDSHHTVEDIGICLGKAFNDALKDPTGMVRFGQAVIPMDESLAEVVVDFSGRPFLAFDVTFPRSRTGDFDVELVEEFFRAFAMNSRVTLHVILRYGANVHHVIEAIFKAFARALAQAVCLDPRIKDVPSTKGMIEA